MKASAPRIAALDALRGLAALAIVVHHYWFLAPAGSRPLESALGIVYEYGRLAVPLFYLLSGYIFFSAYAAALGERRLSGGSFFWLRASRLYPLHLMTLLAVAARASFPRVCISRSSRRSSSLARSLWLTRATWRR